jgi:hypothetical protein
MAYIEYYHDEQRLRAIYEEENDNLIPRGYISIIKPNDKEGGHAEQYGIISYYTRPVENNFVTLVVTSMQDVQEKISNVTAFALVAVLRGIGNIGQIEIKPEEFISPTNSLNLSRGLNKIGALGLVDIMPGVATDINIPRIIRRR